MLTRPRFSLRAQIYLAVLALAVALSVTAGAAWLDAGQQARVRFEREIDDGLDSFKGDFENATRDLLALGNWLVNQKTFVDLVQAREGAGLTRYLETWTELSIADVILVSDNARSTLAELRSSREIGTSESARAASGIAEALAGRRTTGVDQSSSERLQRRVAFPVYSADTHTAVGALVLSFYLDGSFLQYRSRKLDQDVAIVLGDRVWILTLTDAEGKAWQSGAAPAPVVRAQREGRPSDMVEMETPLGKQIFRFKPLDATGANTGALYGVGVSLAVIDRERLAVFRTFWFGLAVIAIGTGIAAFLFVRAITVPLRTLDRAAQRIARGDFSEEITLPRNDELGDLAQRMETMRQQLRETIHSAAVERDRYAAIIQGMGVAAVITDHALKITAVNLAAQSLLQQDEISLNGQSLSGLLVNGKEGKSQAASWNLDEASAERGLVARGRFHLSARPQTLLDVISSPVQLKGQAVGYVHILRDAAAEEQLARVKDEFLMNAAHELRGPLAALRASIELLVEDFVDMDRQDLGVMLRTMQRSVIKFQGLVENLVDIGNIQAGRFRVRPSMTPLEEIIEDAVIQIQPMLQARRQSVETKMDCPASCLVYADRPRIIQVVINLLTNASKYGPEDEPIEIRVFSRERQTVVEVSDRGQGIPPEEQENLFKRFYRGRRAEEEGIGIGLGLALAREIVAAHGGMIDVRSEMGKGTTLWFSLPRAER